jgi:chromosome segregation ATPase
LEGSENPYPLATARALHFDRVSESLPNFKPSQVKPDIQRDGPETTLTHGTYTHSPTELNCLPNVRPVSKSESHTPIPQSPRGKLSTPTKYVSARAVAKRLANAIRGGSKSSKNKVEQKLVMPCSDVQAAPGMLSDDGNGGKGVDQWPESCSRHLSSEQALDQSHIYADFNEKSQISSFRERRLDAQGSCEEREIDMLKSWLDGMKQQGDGVYDDLEKKAKAACERLEMLDEEQATLDDWILSLNDFQASDKMRSSDAVAAVQQRLWRMHEEKKFLALEAASELRQKISERSATKKVFTLMKHEMDAYAKVMEKEKIELQSKLEEEIARRELTWAVKLDRIRSEERDLHERVTNLQEENSYIQREISTLLSRDGNTNGKIKELESQVDSYRVRAEQAKANLDALHQAYAEKEAETCNLRKIVERLPELCGDYDPDYEKRMSTLQQNLQDGRVQDTSAGNRKPSKLQRELCRLSSLEVALRSEMQVLKGSTLGYGDTTVDEYTAAAYGQSNIKELHAELDRLQSHTGELQDDNNILSVKLRLIVREKEEMRKALRDAEEEIHELREEQQRRSYGQEEHGQESSEISQGDGDHELEGDADSQVLYVFY